ncbi:hypothetical protein ACIPJS_28220 [Streptomyces sp. NPDC086783]|uniref:hypothetical protein n=1 Tax=Streptomyces sp. NPDC086783 TaxID=3365758 RepID=UPI00382D567D
MTWPEAAKTSSWPTTERAAVPTALPPGDLFAEPTAEPEPGGRGSAATADDPAPAAPSAADATAGPAGETGDPAAGQADGPAAPPSWERTGEPTHTHDPHEVTVQLDGAGREVGAWPGRRARTAPGGADGSDGPVFVDESGRRGRTFRRLGVLVGLACAVYAVVIGVTLLSGNSNAPWLPVPARQDDPPAGRVDTPPRPVDDADPPGAGSTAPGTGPSAGGTASASPGGGPAARPSGSATAPGATANPRPTAGTARPKPSSTSKDPGPEPSVTVSGPPAPSTSVGGPPSGSSSQPPADEGPGTTTVSDTTGSRHSGTTTVAAAGIPRGEDVL